MVTIAVVMIGLGRWQLHRYEQRTAVNNRIDAGTTAAPVPGPQVLRLGSAPGPDAEWTRVSLDGRYDPANEIVVRGRTLDATVGFEILTPLVLADGAAVLVDRGWLAATGGGATAAVVIPPAPTGPVTVTGRVRLAESRPGSVTITGGHLDVRRIDPVTLAPHLPYPLYGGYVALDAQQPPADATLRPLPTERENAWLNLGYAVQWWMFALLSVSGLIWVIRREAHHPELTGDGPTKTSRSLDRVADADARAGAEAAKQAAGGRGG